MEKFLTKSCTNWFSSKVDLDINFWYLKKMTEADEIESEDIEISRHNKMP